MGGSVGEEGPPKQDDLPQAPPRPDGGCCLCSSADQRETGGGTSADPADPSDPASHRFPQQWIRFEICLCPFLKILWSCRFHQLLWTWLFQNQLLRGLPTSAFHCCCCGSGPGWFQEELQCQQGARYADGPAEYNFEYKVADDE